MADLSEQSGKFLSELRVIDLKQELENRGLDKAGVKATLTERLRKALQEEGENADEFKFDVSVKKMTEKENQDVEETAEDFIDIDNVAESQILDECGAVNGVDEPAQLTTEEEEKLLKEEEDRIKEESEPDKTLVEEDESLKGDSKADEAEIKEVKTEVKIEAAVDETNSEAIAVCSESKQLKEEDMKTEDIKPNTETIKAETSEPTTEKDVKSTIAEENKENSLALDSFDDFPPTPTSVRPLIEFTAQDMIDMDTSSNRNEDDISLIVHVDETTNEFDDILSNASGTSFSTSTRAQTPVSASGQNFEEKRTLVKTEGDATVVDDKVLSENKDASVDKSEKDTEKPSESSDNKIVESTDKEQSTDKEAATDKETSKKEEEKSDDKNKSSSRNLWISGLSNTTRATDLKTIFSKYGKVAGAKVVTNARSPMSRCYGFVTMNTADEASKCIHHLHRTELHGRMISVERAKADPSQAKPTSSTTKKPDDKKDEKTVDKRDDKRTSDRDHRRRLQPERRRYHERSYRRHGSSHRSRSRDRTRQTSRRHSDDKQKTPKKEGEEAKKGEEKVEKKVGEEKKEGVQADKKGEEKKEGEPVETKDGEKKIEETTEEKKAPGAEEKKDEKPEEQKDVKTEGTESEKADGKKDDKKRDSRGKSRGEKEMLSLEKIKEERERERLRLRERRLREEERRRREMLDRDRMRQRDLVIRQREEAIKLQRERDRLRLEREKLEREKLEAERERIRFEREKRERERLELAEQRRQEALRYEERQRALKRPYDRQAADDYWGEPKRAAYEPPPRYNSFDERGSARPAVYDRDAGYDRTRERGYVAGRDPPARFEDRRDDRERRDRIDRDDRRAPSDRYSKSYEMDRTRRDAPVREHAARDHSRHEARRASPHRAPREQSPRREKPRESHRDGRVGTERTYNHNAGAARSEGTWQAPPARRSHDKDAQQYARPPPASAPTNTGESLSSSSASWQDKNRVLVPAATARPNTQWVTPSAAVPTRGIISQPITLQPQHPAAGHPQFLISAANIISAGLGAGLAQASKPNEAARYSAYSAQRRY